MGPEILFAVPYALGFAAVATICGTLFLWLVWAGLRRWGPRSLQEASAKFPIGVVSAVLLCIALPFGCAWACKPVPQPPSLRSVAAFEAPLASAADRAEFLSILGREAAAEGLTLNVVSGAELDEERRMAGATAMAIAAYIWRGEARHTEAEVFEVSQRGDMWIWFFRGEEPALAQRFREEVMRKIVARWPATLAIPVAPNGGLPLKQDLVKTAKGYVIEPARMPSYSCPNRAGAEGAAPPAC